MLEISNEMQGYIAIAFFAIAFPILLFKTFGKSPEERKL